MYTEVGGKYKLYNAGDRIAEMMTYSLPDGHDIHCVARWNLEAPEKEFFSVPKFIILGSAQVPVFFCETLLRPDRYGERGVILVDANWAAPKEPDEAEKLPVAKSEDEAIKKGARHWENYIRKVAQQWLDECNAVRAAGGVPRSASGFVVRALKLCGVADPGQSVLLAAQDNKSELEKLRALLLKQQEQIEALLGGGKDVAKPVQAGARDKAKLTAAAGGKDQSPAAP